MKSIASKKISDSIAGLCLKANFELRPDVLLALRRAYLAESNKRAKRILKAILDNAAIAKKESLAICQDTGLPSLFIELGQDVKINGGLQQAVNKGIAAGYCKGSLRDSIVKDPLKRGKPGYTPAILHVELVKGNKIKITLLPKGFGCENKTRLKMFNPTAGIAEIKKFVLETVSAAGADACPPYVVGVGIGGTADYALLMAKKSLLNKITGYGLRVTSHERQLEQELLRDINRLGIGPMGLGGKTTALAVNVLRHPTHIAGLPVAVNISCHALRSATKVI